MFGISTDGGVQDENGRTLVRDLDADAQTGAKWLRVDINWAQIQGGGPSSYNWTQIDAVVKGAEARGMRVLGVLIYTPVWAAADSSCQRADCAPNVSDFAQFAYGAVTHYAALGVHAYEVWSEENSTAQWLPEPSPSVYAQMLETSYPLIKKADPRSIVVTGGTSPAPTNGIDWSPTDFLAALYRDGARHDFDAVGAHPYTWPALPGQRYTWSAWYQTYGARRSMRSVMVANGDARKKIWGTEFGAPTYGPKGGYVSPATQAETIFDGFKVWSTYRWAGPLFVFEGRDQLPESRHGTVFDYLGLEYQNFVKKPAYAAFKRAVADF